MPTQRKLRQNRPIGRDTPRVDGPLKVTGTAQYASDFHFPDLLYAVFRSRPRSPMGRSRSSTPPPQRRCPASARFCIVKTSGRFSVRLPGRHERHLHRTAAAVRGRCHSLLRPIRRARGGGHFRERQSCGGRGCVSYAKEKPNVEDKLTADDDPDEVMTTYGPAKAPAKRARRCGRSLCQRAGQARPDLRHTGRDARSHRAAGNNRDVGRRQADDLRGIASRLQHARCARANVRFA